MLPKKQSMSRAENVFLAKRKLVDSIYNSAKLEGLNVTFPETQTILDGVNVPNASISDIQTILNLRNAWRLLLGTLDEPLNAEYLCAINAQVSNGESIEWGKLRTGRAGISGTDYIPPIPETDQVDRDLEKINRITDPAGKAAEYFLYGCYTQLFWDGNKRTSTLIANKILIESGEGIFTIPEKSLQTFNEQLSSFYTTGNREPIKTWLKQTCIERIQNPPSAQDG